MSREVELGWAGWTSLLRVVQVVYQQKCNGHCLSDSAQAQQLKQQLRSAQVAGQWRGDTALTRPLFWRRSTASPVFFWRFPRSSLHSVPDTNRPSRLRGRQATWKQAFSCNCSAYQLGQQLRGTVVAAQCRRSCLNILLFWRRSTASLVFRVGACLESSLFPLVPVPNSPPRLCGR